MTHELNEFARGLGGGTTNGADYTRGAIIGEL